MSSDLTVIYVTANKISEQFGSAVRKILVDSIGDAELISVSKKPMDFGRNIVFNGESSYLNIYRETLAGVKAATTKYIAIAEDDTLYTREHFKHRSNPGVFLYDIGVWGLFTWVEPAQFSHRGRRNNSGLICERDLYIEAMEERFAKYPDENKINLSFWAEPGKYESKLRVTYRPTDVFYTHEPLVMFFHEDCTSFNHNGKKKRLGVVRATEVPYWGRAEDVMKLYSR